MLESTKDKCTWSNGLTLERYTGPVLEANEENLETISSALGPSGEGVRRINARAGTIPATKVLRYVYDKAGDRTLVYYLSGKTPMKLVMVASGAAFSTAENQLDLALGTLKIE
jgi:hypothetical protein